jgi:uncharacterized membrane protein
MGTSKPGGRGLLARSFALGLASGMRSTLGFNAPGLRGVRADGLTRPNVARLLAIGGELVVDKLPQTPSRLTPPGLVARFGSGAFGAFQLARQVRAAPRTQVAAVAIGVAAAAGGAYAGAGWRRTAGASGRPDWQGAVAEDALALGLAASAIR